MTDARFNVQPIGWVKSPLIDVDEAPAQGDEGGPDASIVIRPEIQNAMRDLHVGEQVIVLTWLDRADRRVLEVHPRGDPERPLTGVFSTRSPDRPNPIGLHQVEIMNIRRTRIRVRGLEAIDGTPVVDIKPVLGPITQR